MARYLDETQTPLIVAAVECNSIGNNRLEEYCPFTCEDPKLGVIRGRGRATMNWFVHEFKPMIDANIRTLSDQQHVHLRFVDGRTDEFVCRDGVQCHIRQSRLPFPKPSAGRGQTRRIINQAAIAPDTLIHMDYGGYVYHAANLSVLTSCSTALLKKGVDLTFRIAPGGTHCEASWERTSGLWKCLGL
ncbi:MAG: hypothetical protein V8Q79_06435 [Christensenellales bacterium]